jgi:Ni/Co efflux regulator RcnB
MTTRKQLVLLVAMVFTLAGRTTFAQGRGQRQDSDKSNRPTNASMRTGSAELTFGSQERGTLRDWHREHESNLPPGLTKGDRLPPGLQRQLQERGTLPPGLQKKIVPLPADLTRRLPPPPSGCNRVIIGGNIVLIDTKTFYVHAVFSF